MQLVCNCVAIDFDAVMNLKRGLTADQFVERFIVLDVQDVDISQVESSLAESTSGTNSTLTQGLDRATGDGVRSTATTLNSTLTNCTPETDGVDHRG